MSVDKGYGKCPYDDSSVRYPLPSDKSKIPYYNAYISQGGMQLMEMMEKEFPYEWIKQNSKSLKLNDRQIETLSWWIDSNWILGPTVDRLKEWLVKEKRAGRDSGHRNPGTIHGLVKYIFCGYKGIFTKLLKIADVAPRVDKYGNVTFLYSFLNHGVSFENGPYRIIKIGCTDKQMQKVFEKHHESMYIFENTNDDGWKLVDKEAEIYDDMRTMIDITDKLSTY